MSREFDRSRYDVIVAGARCAGASTAMLLARAGLRVLVVDPARRGSDTLSTHALMRGGVLQLHRWGLLEAVRASGTAPIRETTFRYDDEAIAIPIKERDGVGELYAPRRTVLDEILVEGALAAGAEVVHGRSVVDLVRDEQGRVRGATIAGSDRATVDVAADLVIGADGLNSRVARILGLEPYHVAAHATTSIYGYVKDLGLEGYQWYYGPGAAVGAIPTNDGETCVFASVPPDRFASERGGGLEPLYAAVLEEVSENLADRVSSRERAGRLRGFAGEPGFLRPAAGPGWALVGDAAYFKDPVTAHGITDALREAELLVRAVLEGGDEALATYHAERDQRVRGFSAVTERIASFAWTLDEVRADHLVLAREMNALVDEIRTLDGRDGQASPGARNTIADEGSELARAG